MPEPLHKVGMCDCGGVHSAEELLRADNERLRTITDEMVGRAAFAIHSAVRDEEDDDRRPLRELPDDEQAMWRAIAKYALVAALTGKP